MKDLILKTFLRFNIKSTLYHLFELVNLISPQSNGKMAKSLNQNTKDVGVGLSGISDLFSGHLPGD